MESIQQSQNPPALETVTAPSAKKIFSLPIMISSVFIITAVLAGGTGYYFGSMQNTKSIVDNTEVTSTPASETENTACTMDAKLCPDGSSVGRSGPNCEFSECPTGNKPETKPELLLYTNTEFNYTFSYPANWQVTTEDYRIPADPATNNVNIFNPDDKPMERFYSGMKIEYVGMVNISEMMSITKTIINGIPMYKQETMHGENYYINIPDTDSFLYLTGAGGYTDNAETNRVVKEIFSSFRFIQRN